MSKALCLFLKIKMFWEFFISIGEALNILHPLKYILFWYRVVECWLGRLTFFCLSIVLETLHSRTILHQLQRFTDFRIFLHRQHNVTCIFTTSCCDRFPDFGKFLMLPVCRNILIIWMTVYLLIPFLFG